MKKEIIELGEFSVIGILGGTRDENFSVDSLWTTLKERFSEIKDIISYDDKGQIKGIFGLMSDYDTYLAPWKNFKEGLYLAGYVCDKDAIVPEGFTKWDVPQLTYYSLKLEEGDAYQKAFKHMVYYYIEYTEYDLVNAVFDHNDGKNNYLYFPVKKRVPHVNEEVEIEKIAACGNHCGYCFFKKCGGCNNGCDYCSYATMFKDKKCPTVVCVEEKNLKGCYECAELYTCTKGFFSTKQIAKASSIFIKEKGILVFEKTLKKMIMAGVNTTKDISEKGSFEQQLEYMYSFID